jgi:protein TonB
MFEQTLMPETHNKPWTLGASVTLQAAIVGSMVLYSAMHVNPLPMVMPHLNVPMPPVPKLDAVIIVDSFIDHRVGVLNTPVKPFVQPIAIPHGIPHIDDIGSAAPEVAYSTNTALGTGVIGTSIYTASGPRIAPPPPPEPPAAKTANTSAPIRIGGNVMEAKILNRVMPVYPPLAKSMRVSGKVHLVGIISRTGVIEKLDVLDGHPLLVRAALEAVKQWVYQPTTLNGEAVEVLTPIEVNFTLTQ